MTEKYVPREHRLLSLGKPRDAKRRSSGRIFPSYPHTRDRFLNSQQVKKEVKRQADIEKMLKFAVLVWVCTLVHTSLCTMFLRAHVFRNIYIFKASL